MSTRFSEHGRTRKQAAEKILQRLKQGPLLLTGDDGDEFLLKYRRWFETWIEDDLIRLIPELRALQKDKEQSQL